MAEYAERWLASRDARQLSSRDTDRSRMKHHVLPLLGSLRVGGVQRRDLERLVAELDAKVRGESGAKAISAKTANNAWGLVTKMFGDARASSRLGG